MEKYTKEIKRIESVAGRANRSMRKKFIGQKVQAAGSAFLEQIRSECGGVGATSEELEEEREILREQNTAEVVQKPELTVDYLKSIGREDMTSW
jgi:hypothetical protein